MKSFAPAFLKIGIIIDKPAAPSFNQINGSNHQLYPIDKYRFEFYFINKAIKIAIFKLIVLI